MFRRARLLHITVFCMIIFNICNALDVKTLFQFQRLDQNASDLSDSKKNYYQKLYHDLEEIDKVKELKLKVEPKEENNTIKKRITKSEIPEKLQEFIVHKDNAKASAIVGRDHSEKSKNKPVYKAIVGKDHLPVKNDESAADREKRCTDCDDEPKNSSGSLIILPLLAMVVFIILLVARCCRWTQIDVKELSMIVESPQRKSLARALLSVQTGADMQRRGSGDVDSDSKQLLLLPLLLSGLTPQLRRQSIASPVRRGGSVRSTSNRGSIKSRNDSFKKRKWYQKMRADSQVPGDSDPHPVWGPAPEPIPFLREMSSLSGLTINSGETDSLKLDKDSVSSTPLKKRSKSFHGRSVTIKAECHTIESKDYNEPYTISGGIDIGVGTDPTYFTDDHLPLAKWKHRSRTQAIPKKTRRKTDAHRFSAPGQLYSPPGQLYIRSNQSNEGEENESSPMLNQYTIDNDNVSSSEELDALVVSKRVPYEVDFEYILESQKSPCISFSDSISLDDVFGPPSPVSSHHSIEDSGYHNHFPRSPLSPARPPPRDSVSDDSAVATSATSSTTKTDTLKKSLDQANINIREKCTLNKRSNENNNEVNGHGESSHHEDDKVYFYMSRSDDHLCVSEFSQPSAELCSTKTDDELIRPTPGHSIRGKRPPKLAEICQNRLMDKYSSRIKTDEVSIVSSRESSNKNSNINDNDLNPNLPREVVITIDNENNSNIVLNNNPYSEEEEKEYMV